MDCGLWLTPIHIAKWLINTTHGLSCKQSKVLVVSQDMVMTTTLLLKKNLLSLYEHVDCRTCLSLLVTADE